MLLSAEIRWFWQAAAPTSLREWFMDDKIHGCKLGGGPPAREDVYLIGRDQHELGIKIRGAKGGLNDDAALTSKFNDVEVKGLVAVDWGVMTSGPLAGPVEIWCKWPFGRIDAGTTLRCSLTKTRWLRKFDTAGPYPVEIPLGPDEKPIEESRNACLPTLGCNVELTEVRLSNGALWASFGLEAFGDLSTVADDLRAVATELSKRGRGPEISAGLLLSYPLWISRFAVTFDRI